ncbi:MAG TPA: MFS transporter [Methanomassiliicoccales archaeon]|nr:MFS transporter [Methanomassiliicoccales archaeon]
MSGDQDPGQRRTAIGMATILFLVTLAAYIARVNLSVALPFIGEAYGWNAEQLGVYGGILLGIFLVGYGLSNVFVSPLVDYFGPRKSMMVAVAVFSLLTFLTGVIGLVFVLLISARLLLGLSQGIIYPSASKVTQAWFAPGDRSKINSLHLSSSFVSNLLVPLFLIPLILLTDWRFAFFAVAVVSVLTLIPLWLYLRDCPGPAPCTVRMSLRDVVSKARSDMRSALKVKGLLRLSAGYAAGDLVFWGLSLWLPTYLVVAKGFQTGELALAASLPYIGGLVGLYIGSVLSDRTGKRVLITTSFLVACAASLVLLIGAQDQALVIIVLGAVFFFVGILPPNAFTLLQGVCPAERIGSATGIMNGIAVGIGVFGPLILGMAVASTGSYDSGLLLLAAMAILSAIILWPFRRQESRPRPPE